MKNIKRWLAFFVVVILLIGVAFNSRSPIVASQIEENLTGTDGTAEANEGTIQGETEDPESVESTEQPQVETPEEETTEAASEAEGTTQEPHTEETKTVTTEYTYEDGEKKVIVTLSDGTAIPEGSELKVKELHENMTEQADADKFNWVNGLVTTKATEENFVIDGYKYYDIYFIYEGSHIIPSTGDMTVDISYKQGTINVPESYTQSVAEGKEVMTYQVTETADENGHTIYYMDDLNAKKVHQEANGEIAQLEGFHVDGNGNVNAIKFKQAEKTYLPFALIWKENIKAEETVQPEEDIKTEDTKTEDTKTEDTKTEDTKTEDEKSEDTKAEDTKTEEETKPAVLEYEDDEVKILVSAEKEDIIPEGATLKVVPILKEDEKTQEQYKEVQQKVEEKASQDNTQMAGFLAYDITFVDKEGNKLEPNGEVKVSMEYKNPVIPEEIDEDTAKEAAVTILHLEENENGEVENVVDMVAEKNVDAKVETQDAAKVEKAEFATTSFSVFTITWTVEQSGYSAYMKLHYVDENGNPLQGKQTDTIPLTTTDGAITDIAGYVKDRLPDGYVVVRYVAENFADGKNIESQVQYKSEQGGAKFMSLQQKGSSDWEKWFEFTKEGQAKGELYVVCKEGTLSIKDNIATDGSLTVEHNLENAADYLWFRSDSSDGTYTEVERVEYRGNYANISEDGQKLYPAYDDGARKWYKAEVKLRDGTTLVTDPIQVAYYGTLQNGDFETPQIKEQKPFKATQLSNQYYKDNNGVWQTTGIGTGDKTGADIEILLATESYKDAYKWYGDMIAPDGVQFAELNCEAAGALYQDVLTYNEQSLNWWLSHRARGSKQNRTAEYDTMYLVIMPTSIALTGASDGSELDTQDELAAYLSKKGVNISSKYTSVGEANVYQEDAEGVYVYRITSNDQSWNHLSKINDYIAKSHATRFFFVAGKTASNNNTIGNFLDRVGFSQELPPVEDNEFSLEIIKQFEGLGNAGITAVRENIEFAISAIDKGTNTKLSQDEVEKLFGVSTIRGADMTLRVDGSLYYSLANKKISNSKQYEVTITEKNAELSEYELTTSAKTTVTFNGESSEPTEGAVIEDLKGKTTAKVEFTNSYKNLNYKNVNFTKVWDDANNQFNTRPVSLSVTLKGSVDVEGEDGNKRTIELDLKELYDVRVTAALREANDWKTSWEVPVYYDHNGVKVKINYTVVEGEINSDYVYEAANNGVAQEGEGSDEDPTDFSDVTNESESLPVVSSSGLETFSQRATSRNYENNENGTDAVVKKGSSSVSTKAITVVKKWVGGTTRNQIDVSLMQSENDKDAVIYETVTLNDENNWTHTWKNLPSEKTAGESKVTYTYAVREENTPRNYTSSIEYDDKENKTNVTITNTFDPNCEDENYYIENVLQTETLTLQKIWEDNEDEFKLRPALLEINVGRGSENLKFYVNSNEGWEKTVTLPKRKYMDYTAEEVLNSDVYKQESIVKIETADGLKFIFTNVLKDASVVVSKVWNDGEVGGRPDEISFMLQYRQAGSEEKWKDYAEYKINSTDLVDGKSWTKVISDLPIAYEYRVKEMHVLDGYNSKVGKSDNNYTITNTLKWSVRKTSDPYGDEAIENLAGGEFELKKDGNTIATGTSGSDGMIAWSVVEGQTVNLDELEGTYTIHETKAPTGYAISSTDWTLTFTNGLLETLDGVDVSGTVDEGVVISITNKALYELPETGGIGTFWYTAGGTLLMALAGFLALYKNKKRKV